MNQNDQFYFLKNNQISPDTFSLTQLYQPILGADGRTVYDFLLAFFDHGRAAHRFTDILNHVQFGQDRLFRALDVLGALGLIQLYQTPQQDWVIKLNSPLDRETFLNNPILRQLLANHIGEFSVKDLQMTLPPGLIDQTKSFSQVFTEKGELYHKPLQGRVAFELPYFKQEMLRQQLAFKDEAKDVIALYHLADHYGKNWYDLLLLAKETAVEGLISTDRLRVKLDNLATSKPAPPALSNQEKSIIHLAKSLKHREYLEAIKKDRKGFIIPSEVDMLTALSQEGILDEVINLLVLYTLHKTKSINLNKGFLYKVANDVLHRNLTRAEEVYAYLFGKREQVLASKKQGARTNVPEWSNPDYKETATEEEQLALNRQIDELLAQLDEEE